MTLPDRELPGHVRNTALVQISYPTSNTSDDRNVSLRIEDEASGLTLFTAEIPPKAWVEILSTLGTRVEGHTTSHPERIGREMFVESRHLGRVSDEYAEVVRSEEEKRGWDTAEIHRTNQGLRLVTRNEARRERFPDHREDIGGSTKRGEPGSR